jgi:hypothetical protein
MLRRFAGCGFPVAEVPRGFSQGAVILRGSAQRDGLAVDLGGDLG